MVKLRITGAGLTLAMLAMTAHPAFAGEVAASATAPAVAAAMPEPAPRPSFVPADFTAPVLVEATGFKLVPLSPAVVKQDFDAYMSSIEHLQKTFSRSTNWPRPGITDADAMRDMEGEQGRFTSRKSFSYSVLTPDGSRERGSVYVQPSSVGGYDAVVKMWVTKADYDAGFDTELYTWVTGWVQANWPFKKVAYPGRAIDWATWDSLVAANKAAAVAPK
jgi:hypothetical protein